MGCSRCNRKASEKKVNTFRGGSSDPKASSVDLSKSLDGVATFGVTYPLIRNHQYRPPAGGWAVRVTIRGSVRSFSGTPSGIAGSIHDAYRRAGSVIPVERIWDFLNQTWILADPARALVPPSQEVVSKINANAHLMDDPAHTQSTILSALANYGMKGFFDEEFFKTSVDWAVAKADPAVSEVGLEGLHEALTKHRLDMPVSDVKDEHDAAIWVHGLMNRASVVLSFADAIRKYHWAFSLETDPPTPV